MKCQKAVFPKEKENDKAYGKGALALN